VLSPKIFAPRSVGAGEVTGTGGITAIAISQLGPEIH
jgi:hypothetical protein